MALILYIVIKTCIELHTLRQTDLLLLMEVGAS